MYGTYVNRNYSSAHDHCECCWRDLVIGYDELKLTDVPANFEPRYFAIVIVNSVFVNSDRSVFHITSRINTIKHGAS